MSEVSIRSGLAYLREAQKSWSSIRWTLRLFEWVFNKTGLNLGLEKGKGYGGTTAESKNHSQTGPQDAYANTSLEMDASYTGMWESSQDALGDEFELELEHWVRNGSLA